MPVLWTYSRRRRRASPPGGPDGRSRVYPSTDEGGRYAVGSGIGGGCEYAGVTILSEMYDIERKRPR